jgi:ankyrin repeat protein
MNLLLILILWGADLSKVDNNSSTALHWAAYKG